MAWENDLANKIAPGAIPSPIDTPAVESHAGGDPFVVTPHNTPGLKNMMPKMPHPIEPVIPKINDLPKESIAMSISNEDILKKIEAYVAGPISARPDTPNIQDVEHERRVEVKSREGQGDVQSKDDGRLKQNKENKKHKELQNEAVALEERAGSADKEEKHEESDVVKAPFERARTDHRASMDLLSDTVRPPGAEKPITNPFDDPRGLRTPLEKMPAVPQKVNIPGERGTGLTPPSPRPQHPTYAPKEWAMRQQPQDPQLQTYVNRALGPNPNPQMLDIMHQKIKNLQNVATTREEKDELQKYASLLADAILKNM